MIGIAHNLFCGQQLSCYPLKTYKLINLVDNEVLRQNSQSKSLDPTIQKFIKLMRNLTQLILADSSHQQTIYECLNSQEIKRLFESIHDDNQQIRMTAINFLSHLLYNNSRIIELIGVLEGYQPPTGLRKYIIGGLDHYKLQPNDLKRIFPIKQPEAVYSMTKVKYQSGTLAWAIDIKSFKVQYFTTSKAQNLQSFPFDPNQWIVGIFVRAEECQEAQIERKINTGNGNRYKISKK